MSFIAEIKNISIYPKGNEYTLFGIVEQRSKIFKVIYRGSPKQVSEMISHMGPIRFYVDGAPQSGTYKGQPIQVYNVKSFVPVSKPNVAQTTLALPTPDFEVE